MSNRPIISILAAAIATASFALHAQDKKGAAKQEAKAAAKAEAKGHAGHAHGSKMESQHAMCIGCHGIPGYKTAFPEAYHVPKIAGQSPAYIVNALKAYRSGERAHPSMRGIAASLTDEDMAALAAYYGGTK